MALELAAGIAGLIGIADVILTKGLRFYSQSKKAIPEIQSLLKEIASLSGALFTLEKTHGVLKAISDGPVDRTSNSTIYIKDCEKFILELKANLEKCEPKDDTMWEKAKASLKWPFSASETRELTQTVQRLKSTILLSTEADSLHAMCKLLSGQKSVQESLERVEKEQERISRLKGKKQLDSHKESTLDWFSTYKTRKHAEMKRSRYPGTAIWFRDCEKYKDWLATPNASLWFDGIPGAGKSVLTSAIIEDLELLEDDETALAYFYIEYSSPESQKFHSLAGSLLRQLVEQNPNSFHILEQYKTSGDFTDKTVDDVLMIITELSNFFSTTMIVVDGLDECEREVKDRRDVLHFISALGRGVGSIKVIATSRTIVDIVNTLNGFSNISIAATSADIKLYVAGELEMRQRSNVEFYGIQFQDPHLKEEIIDALVDKGNGMFQWVRCQLDELSRTLGDNAKRDALRKLPKDLPETYRRILDRVAESNRQLVATAFLWITPTNKSYSINISQLVDIMSHTFHETITIRHIQSSCSSLIKFDYDDNETHVKFSHFSVAEFLGSGKAKVEWYYQSYSMPAHIWYKRTLAIINYMSSCPWEKDMRAVCRVGPSEHTFAEFIEKNFHSLSWGRFHWRYDFQNGPDVERKSIREVVEKLEIIFQDQTKECWKFFARNAFQLCFQRRLEEFNALFGASVSLSTSINEIVESRIHVACFLSIYDMVSPLVNEDPRIVDCATSCGITPLHAWLLGRFLYKLDDSPGDYDRDIDERKILLRLRPTAGVDFKTVLIRYLGPIRLYSGIFLRSDYVVIEGFTDWVLRNKAKKARRQITEDLKYYLKKGSNEGVQSYARRCIFNDGWVGSFWMVLLKSQLFNKKLAQKWLGMMVEAFSVDHPPNNSHTKGFTLVQVILDEIENDLCHYGPQTLMVLFEIGILGALKDSERSDVIDRMTLSLCDLQSTGDMHISTAVQCFTATVQSANRHAAADKVNYADILEFFRRTLNSGILEPVHRNVGCLDEIRALLDIDSLETKTWEEITHSITHATKEFQKLIKLCFHGLFRKNVANVGVNCPQNASDAENDLDRTRTASGFGRQIMDGSDDELDNDFDCNSDDSSGSGSLMSFESEANGDDESEEGGDRDASHNTPLHLAIRLHPAPILEALLNDDAKVDLDIGSNNIDWMPLGLAITLEKPDHVKVLLQHKADRFLVDIYGKTYLHLLVKTGNLDLLEIFLKQPVWWTEELLGRQNISNNLESGVQICLEVFAKGFEALQSLNPVASKSISPSLQNIIGQINTLSEKRNSGSEGNEKNLPVKEVTGLVGGDGNNNMVERRLLLPVSQKEA